MIPPDGFSFVLAE
jgi:type VI secretion system secreted protein Hcp